MKRILRIATPTGHHMWSGSSMVCKGAEEEPRMGGLSDDLRCCHRLVIFERTLFGDTWKLAKKKIRFGDYFDTTSMI